MTLREWWDGRERSGECISGVWYVSVGQPAGRNFLWMDDPDDTDDENLYGLVDSMAEIVEESWWSLEGEATDRGRSWRAADPSLGVGPDGSKMTWLHVYSED